MKIPKTKWDILSEYGDLSIWTLALGYTPVIGSCSSPFRVDKHPSCSFYISKNGYLRFKDFTTGDNYGAIDAYEIKTGLSYRTIPDKIDDIDIQEQQKIKKLSKNKSKSKNSKVDIEIIKGNWTETRLNYWTRYGIDEELLREEVTPCTKVLVHKNTKDYALKVDYHCYAYEFSNTNHYKIYQPYSETHKFIGNTTTNDIYGYSDLEGYDLNIITSSGKDYLLLKSLRDEHDLQFDVLAPNGEGYVVPEFYRKKLTNNILLYYDNDAPGIKNAQRHCQIYDNCNYIHNPFDKPKDPSDWSLKDRDEFIDFLFTKINPYV